LGRRIRNLRRQKRWTQQELGNQADVNYKFIGEIERGQQNPSFDILSKISRALGVDLPVLFQFEPEISDRKDIEDKIRQILNGMTDVELGKVLLVLRSLYPVH